ncbi:MAG: biotin transporter BioY [Collinsella sp.]|nr:biotin transporter BioY [Collinsella sp.]
MNRPSTRDIAYSALFVVLIAVGAFVKVPGPLCPLTLQPVMVSLTGLLLGPRLGPRAVAAYVVAGLAGLPIFAGGGGPGYIMSPSFGYLIGFILDAWIVARLAPPSAPVTRWRRMLACLAGLLALYAVGMTHLYLVSNLVLGTPVTVGSLFMFSFLLVLPGDLILIPVAAEVAGRLAPLMHPADADGGPVRQTGR